MSDGTGIPEPPAHVPSGDSSAVPRSGSAAGIPNPPDVRGAPARSAPITGHRRRRRRWGRAVAIAAISFAVVAIVIARMRDDDGATLEELRIGDCIEALTDSTFTSVTTVDCDEPHTAEVFQVGRAEDEIDLTEGASSDAQVEQICRADADPTVLRAIRTTLQDGQSFASFLVEGTAKGRVACLINTPRRTGSIVAAVIDTSTTSG